MNSPESMDWKKEFREKFFIQNGELKPETFVDIESFISSLLTNQKREIFEEAAKTLKQHCPNCGGQGFIIKTVAGHGCDGTQESCDETCPIPIPEQEQCQFCDELEIIAQSIRNLANKGANS